MTTKRFYLLNYNNYPIYDSLLDEEYNAQFKAQREKLCLLLNELHEENQRLTEKLNQTALELVDGVISQGKAVEISEMSYSEFLDYRAKNGKPMELQL